MNLLLVDDDPFVLKLLSLQLRNLNLKSRGIDELLVCENGHDAVALLQRPDAGVGLVFCDLQMPEMDGVELVRHLVHLQYNGGLVLISGEDQRVLQAAERLARAHRLQVLGALHKPIAPEQLKATLDRMFSSLELTPLQRSKRYDAEALAQAIASGQLLNYYQPQVDFARGELVGVEALVRWRHPQDGLVLPALFVPLAEANGLIDELAREVMSTALIDAKAWRERGLAHKVSVNVSMANLAELHFPDWLAGEAAAAGVPLSALTLEVTESQLMKDPCAALDILTRLRLKGIDLSIDDFGTGYSSLAQLRDLPFNELKIDQGFVHGAHSDAALAALLEASLNLARQLDIDTVAEGVQDEADWNHLRACGCDVAQGYFVGRPMPAEQLNDWLGDWARLRDALIDR